MGNYGAFFEEARRDGPDAGGRRGDDLAASPLHALLVAAESALWRMTGGIWRFIFWRLPEWLLRALLETVGPLSVRLARVLFVLCLWLALVFAVPTAVIAARMSFWWGLAAGTWTALAGMGSVWGLVHLERRRRHRRDGARREGVRPAGLL